MESVQDELFVKVPEKATSNAAPFPAYVDPLSAITPQPDAELDDPRVEAIMPSSIGFARSIRSKLAIIIMIVRRFNICITSKLFDELHPLRGLTYMCGTISGQFLF